jgi:hypothetical protein
MENHPIQSMDSSPQKRSNLLVTLLVIVIILAFVLGGLIVYILLNKTNSSTTETTTPTLTQASPTTTLSPVQTNSSFCIPQNLSATLSLSPGAGNVYGTFKVTNTSNEPCQIEGNHFIQPNFDSNTIKNLTVTHQGTNTTDIYTLQPNKSVFSQVHYPNGPQCSGPTVQDPVSFTYQIADNTEVTFKDAMNGKQNFVVNGCSSPTEKTEITIWNMSDQPITP